MSLVTLASVKEQFGISRTSEDAQLTRWIRQACGLIRRVGRRYFGGVIESVSINATAAVVTSIGHGLSTGDTVVITGSNSTPALDGEQTITRLSADTFSVPVATTVAGTAGFYGIKRTEFYAGSDSPQLILRERPVQSVSAVYLDNAAYYGQADGAFADDTLLTAGTDYCLTQGEAGLSKSGLLLRIGGVWPGVNTTMQGLLAQGISEGVGNVKVTYTAGYREIPPEIELLACQLVAELRACADKGGPLVSESFDYYTYQRAGADEQMRLPLSTRRLLAQIKPLAI